MSKGEHKKPAYLKIQPFDQVPSFQDESNSLFESRAICRYVSEKYANQGNQRLYPTNPLAKASMEQWLEAEGQSFNPSTSALVFQLAFAPRMKLKQAMAVIKQNQEKLEKVLDVYEVRLGDSRFLAGDEFTLADLSHLPNTQYLVSSTTRERCSRRGRMWVGGGARYRPEQESIRLLSAASIYISLQNKSRVGS